MPPKRALPATIALVLFAALSPSAALGAPSCLGSESGKKQAFFGDLHIHTNYSLDTYFFNSNNSPRDAVRFAKGEPACMVPAGGNSSDPHTCDHTVRIDRPLDFAAVTDHAEFLGGWIYVCEGGPGGLLPPGANPVCELLGQNTRDNIRELARGNTPPTTAIVLGTLEQQQLIRRTAWQDIQLMNDEENEPCSFTTFDGYEFSSNKNGQMLHRNVIFNGTVRPADVFPSTNFGGYLVEGDPNVNDEWKLFDHLKNECIGVAGCEVLTIPHNPNLSDGRMFLPPDPLTGLPIARDALPLTPQDALTRHDMDRLVEISQHKGQSECAAGLNDFLEGEETSCGFEQYKHVCGPQSRAKNGGTLPAQCAAWCSTPPNPASDAPWCRNLTMGSSDNVRCDAAAPDGASTPEDCTTPWDMVRNSYIAGLRMRSVVGVNPYQGGFIGSSDNHNGTAGNTQEAVFEGHGGLLDNEAKKQLGFWSCSNEADPLSPGDPNANTNCQDREFLDWSRPLNPGGLAGLWAEENTRDALFSAMKRREAFGTSGTRMEIRALATWDDLESQQIQGWCNALDQGRSPLDSGALEGVAMGGVLPPHADPERAPALIVWARQDPLDDPAFGRAQAVPLQRTDIVKGWVENGELKTKTFDVSSTSAPVTKPNGDCSVNVATHPERLCALWRDPEFDPSQDAYYYARAFEIPTCRYTAWQCHVRAPGAPVDCSKLDGNGVFSGEWSHWRGYEGCCAIERNADSLGFAGASPVTPFDTVEERAWASPIWYEPLPEPSSLALLASGAAVLAALARRRAPR